MSYISDCKTAYFDPNTTVNMNYNYSTYGSAEEAMKAGNCTTNDTYYRNKFTDYARYGSCANAATVETSGGFVSDGVDVWMEGSTRRNAQGMGRVPCSPDCETPAEACAQGETWPLLINKIYGTNYQPVTTTEGFQLFENKSNTTIIVVIVVLIIMSIGLYFALRK
jgi:hypothetical protein